MKKLTIYLTLFLSAGLTGCAHHKFVNPNVAPTGDSQTLPGTANGFKGGKNDQYFKCDTDRIKQIEIKQDLGDLLVALVTLGASQNIDVTYDCAKVTPSDDGEI